MYRLKNRQKQIPNGYQFYCPVLKYKPLKWSSFDVICQGILSSRKANAGLAKANNLSFDPGAIADELDAYNTAICQAHGYTDFITDGVGGPPPAPPFPVGQRLYANPNQQGQQSSRIQRLKNVAVGADTLVEWIASGAEAVPQEQASSRASVCAVCPKNGKGDWTTWFTAPVANAIRATISRKREMKLETPYDDQIGICTACDCPMELKVHVPFEKFFPKMSETAKVDLNKQDPVCWIITEGNYSK